MSGSNYLVSVKSVMQSERKLKVRGLLLLFTGANQFNDIEKDKQDTAFIHTLLYCDMDKGIIDVYELLMSTGFIAKQLLRECLVIVAKLI